jgi:LPXTG-motif cell wall-anchored protein
MREPFRQITINYAPVKVIGIPGLTLVAIAVALVVEFPEGRWLLLAGLTGGALLGAAMILVRRRRDGLDAGGGHGELLEGLTADRQRSESHDSRGSSRIELRFA